MTSNCDCTYVQGIHHYHLYYYVYKYKSYLTLSQPMSHTRVMKLIVSSGEGKGVLISKNELLIKSDTCMAPR